MERCTDTPIALLVYDMHTPYICTHHRLSGLGRYDSIIYNQLDRFKEVVRELFKNTRSELPNTT